MRNFRSRIAVPWLRLLVLALASMIQVQAQTGAIPAGSHPGVVNRDVPTERHGSPALTTANVPVAFEPNRGQFISRVRFAAHAEGALILLTDQGAEIELAESGSRTGRRASPQIRILKLSVEGMGDNVKLTGAGELPGKVNYLVGSDRSRWITNVTTYRRVQYTSGAGNVGLVFYGNDQHALEYDLIVPPGLDAKKIRLRVEGADRLARDGSGDLIIRVGGRIIRQRRPVAYAESEQGRRSVAVNYVLLKPTEVGFQVGQFDRREQLVIDPILIYSSYLAGNLADTEARGVAADSAGNTYVTGHTRSYYFPTTAGSVEQRCVASTVPAGGCSAILMAFVTKVNPTGTEMVYSTFLGGTSGAVNEGVDGAIAVGADGSAYVAGTIAAEIDFAAWPLPPSAQSQPPCQGSPSASGAGGAGFLVRLSPDGSNLGYSFLLDLGSPFATYAKSLALDSSGNAYVGGFFVSTDNSGNLGKQAFVAKIDPTQCDNPAGNLGGGGVWIKRFGTAGKNTEALGVAVDSSGNTYVTGSTDDPNFPTTPGTFQSNPPSTTCFGPQCTGGFVAKLSADGTQFLFSTYLGGDYSDVPSGIVVDSNGNATVTGTTLSSDFPTGFASTKFLTCGSVGLSAVFVTQLNSTASQPNWSTCLGGTTQPQQGLAIAKDPADNVYVTGFTQSSDFPVAGAAPPSNCSLPNPGFGNGGSVFVTSFSPIGMVRFSILTGGASESSIGQGIASDSQANIYVAGETSALDFPVSPPPGFLPPTSSFPKTSNGVAGNGFVFKIGRASTVTDLTSSANPSVAGNGITLSVSVTSPNCTPTGTVSFSDGGTVLGSVSLAAGSASFTTSSLAVGTHNITASYGGDINFAGSSGSLQQVVNQAPAATTTTITASPNPAQIAQLISFTITITSTGPNVPTGSFQFRDGQSVLATFPIVPGTPTVVNTAYGFAGTHSFTATYLGDAFNAGSTSAP